PSEKAWAEIETRIRKKDTSRRILWFLLIGFFLLAGGGYLFLNDGEVVDKEIAYKSSNNSKAGVQEHPDNSRPSLNTLTERSQDALYERKELSVPSEEINMDNPSDPLVSFTDSHQNFKETETVSQEAVAKEKGMIPGETTGVGIEKEAKVSGANS